MLGSRKLLSHPVERCVFHFDGVLSVQLPLSDLRVRFGLRSIKFSLDFLVILLKANHMGWHQTFILFHFDY